jgi:hypothetical protein
MTVVDERKYFTVTEAAILLGWTVDHVWEAVEKDVLPAVAPAYWGQPERFDYRYVPGYVALAICKADVEEIRWSSSPLGAARFPAKPDNIRLLAEYVNELVSRKAQGEAVAAEAVKAVLADQTDHTNQERASRQDDMAVELDDILREMEKAGERIVPAIVMSKLKVRAGYPKSSSQKTFRKGFCGCVAILAGLKS